MTREAPRILYEDDCLIAVEKPVGMPTQPDLTGQESVLSYLQERYPYVGLVHRLDTATGGVLVFAKDKSCVGKLTETVNDKENTQKIYLALIPSPPPAPEGVWEDDLYHDKQRNKSFVVQPNAKGEVRRGAKHAKLWYSVVDTLPEGMTLVKVRLFTGRTHQIRVQFASRGLPLLGDGKYGSRSTVKQQGFALWAYKLSFLHPKTQALVEITSTPPLQTGHWLIWYSAARAIAERKNREKLPSGE